MKKYFDKENNRLVYLGVKAQSKYWDQHWKSLSKKMNYDPFVVNITTRYLERGKRILEGGCGLGAKVYSLQKAGYNATDLDYASETVKSLKESNPELDIHLGDVRALPFPNQEFDGYWSLGVIEHFYEGYSDISSEMSRVLKNDGYLFLTVPYLSLIRRIKSTLRLYPFFSSENLAKENGEFYQFAISKEEILEHFKARGFELIMSKKLDGLKGFKDEIPKSQNLQKIYTSKHFLLKIIRRLLNMFLAPLAAHIRLYVFRKV